eukprot:TRINITY_DN179_c0_g1_i1.p1 TRINITY_DN179_c0_g1~~TRINITY_DN179_c0_g1_i1.p1  ORF type:complete len:267 (-),score=44.11 TRINITY_DN179_c0_g1_i1:261-1061(-)
MASSAHKKVVRLLYKDCLHYGKAYYKQLLRGQGFVGFEEMFFFHELPEFKKIQERILQKPLEVSPQLKWADFDIPNLIRSRFRSNQGERNESNIQAQMHDGFYFLSRANSRLNTLSTFEYAPNSITNENDVTITLNPKLDSDNGRYDCSIKVTNHSQHELQLVKTEWMIYSQEGPMFYDKGDQNFIHTIPSSETLDYVKSTQIAWKHYGTMKGLFTFQYTDHQAEETKSFCVEVAPVVLSGSEGAPFQWKAKPDTSSMFHQLSKSN